MQNNDNSNFLLFKVLTIIYYLLNANILYALAHVNILPLGGYDMVVILAFPNIVYGVNFCSPCNTKTFAPIPLSPLWPGEGYFDQA